MREFKIYIIDNSENDILLSDFKDSDSPTLTFNEQLEENEHDNYTFSFSVVSKISQNLDSSLEPQIYLVKYLQMGRNLKLELEGKEGYIKFVITSITPEESSQNIVYNINCQDYASYMFSKTGIGMEINTMEDEDYHKSGMKSNLFQISNYVLRKGGLQKIDYPTLSDIEIAGENLVDLASIGFKDDILISKPESINNDIILDFGDFTGYISHSFAWSNNYKINNSHIIHDYVDIKLTTSSEHTLGGEPISFNITFPNEEPIVVKSLEADSMEIMAGQGSGGEPYIQYYFNIRLCNIKISKENCGVYSVNSIGGVGLSLDLLSNGSYYPLFPSMYLMNINDIKFLMKNKFYLYELDTSGEGSGDPTCISFIYNGDSFICKDFSEWPYIYSIKAPRVFYRLNETSWKINNVNLLEKNINLDISNSNIYNALIELANLTETYLKFNYETKTIDFIDRDSEVNERNFFLSSEVNLSSLDLNYNIDEFYSILYVSGADDEYGMDTGLTPSIPEEALKFFNVVNDDSYTGILKFGKNSNDSKSYYTRVLHDRTNNEPVWLENLNGEIYEKNLKFAKIADKIPYLDNFILDFSYFIDVGLLSSSAGVMNYLTEKLLKININYQYWIRKKYETEFEIFDIENRILNQCEILLKGSKDNYIEINEKLNKEFYLEGEFPFFQNMVKYKGENFLIEKLNKYIEDTIEMIEERDKASKDLNCLQDLFNNESDENKQKDIKVDIAAKQEDIDMYKAYVGNWTYDRMLQELVKGDSYGKYCHFIECFQDNLKNFNSHYQGEIIYDEYIKIKEKKEDFWFDFKNTYGEYLIEGFYENDSEFDPVKLYNQAKIYSTIHGQPTVDYSISYIDISDVIGKDLQKIQVGDIIKIPTKHLGILDKDSEIQVVSISSVLRNPGDIQLTVNRTDYKVIKKLLDSLQK